MKLVFVTLTILWLPVQAFGAAPAYFNSAEDLPQGLSEGAEVLPKEMDTTVPIGRFQLTLGKQTVWDLSSKKEPLEMSVAYVLDTSTGNLFVCRSFVDPDKRAQNLCKPFEYVRGKTP